MKKLMYILILIVFLVGITPPTVARAEPESILEIESSNPVRTSYWLDETGPHSIWEATYGLRFKYQMDADPELELVARKRL